LGEKLTAGGGGSNYIARGSQAAARLGVGVGSSGAVTAAVLRGGSGEAALVKEKSVV
jgi:hypothetical protein